MTIIFYYYNETYQADLSKPLDISIPIQFEIVGGNKSVENPNAWFCPSPEMQPQQFGDVKIAVSAGAAVNSFCVRLYPHGNGTHTEGVGHLLKTTEWHTVNSVLKNFHCLARLISIYPYKIENGDAVISKGQLEEAFENKETEKFDALIVRTLPNEGFKKKRHWSGTNPPYFAADALAFLAEKGIKHLLTDLPSVDREDDGGKVAAHKAFWNLEDNPRLDATITEMIYVENAIKDDLYLLNLQIPSFEIDAAPSKPVLFQIEKKSNPL
jgi:arylformamidase